jgi:hypothetical protein
MLWFHRPFNFPSAINDIRSTAAQPNHQTEALLRDLEYQTASGAVDRRSDGYKPSAALECAHDRAGNGGWWNRDNC